MLRVRDIRNQIVTDFLQGDWVIDRTGAKTVEVIGATFIADEDYVIRKPAYEYIRRELRWYEMQSLYVDDIPGETPQIWKDISSEEGKINSNYGWCIYSDENGNQYQKVKQELTTSENQFRLANKKAEELTIKKLTHGNPTMKEKFDELKEKE